MGHGILRKIIHDILLVQGVFEGILLIEVLSYLDEHPLDSLLLSKGNLIKIRKAS